MDYRILALDIDGTLTNSRKEISPATLAALTEIQERGIRIVLASGRPTAGCRHLVSRLRLSEFGGFLLSYNGGRMTDCATGEILHQHTLQREVVPELFEYAISHGAGLMTYRDTGILTGTPVDEYMEIEARINRMQLVEVCDFPSRVRFDVPKCLMTAEPEKLAQIEIELRERYAGRLSIYRSEPYFLEIMPLGVDKASSLSVLLEHLNLSRDQLISCGDGYNDISMIRFAGLGVAMNNAHPGVKSVADYVTESNDHDGIRRVIDTFIRRPLRVRKTRAA